MEFKKDGIIVRRAQKVLGEAVELLEEIQKDGLFTTLEQGKFGDVKRPRNGGKGLDGVFVKDAEYMNPFVPLMLGGER